MLKVLSVFNNIARYTTLKDAWGLSLFITMDNEKILFDTGSDADILSHNLNALDLKSSDITKVIISHKHRDHTGSLAYVLKGNRGNIDLCLPLSFGAGDTEALRPLCRDIRLMPERRSRISDNLHSSGSMGFLVKEQALVIEAPKGLVVVVGCGHPGIVNMCERIMCDFGKGIYAVLGGFHLEHCAAFMIRRLCRRFFRMGVEKVGPCHCSGDRAFDILRDDFRDSFMDLSLGRELLLF